MTSSTLSQAMDDEFLEELLDSFRLDGCLCEVIYPDGKAIEDDIWRVQDTLVHQRKSQNVSRPPRTRFLERSCGGSSIILKWTS